MKKRKYRMKQRAVRQQETRDRIVDAAVALHEELGPAATTISALADRAGVQRLTVYRHFRSELEILQACSAKWFGRNPPPDISRIGHEEPAKRTRAIFLALYAYYQETGTMWTSLYRDLGKVDSLDEQMAPFEDYLSAVGAELMAAWAPCKSRRFQATVGHALRFATWQSLKDQGLGRSTMAELVSLWIEAAASQGARKGL